MKSKLLAIFLLGLVLETVGADATGLSGTWAFSVGLDDGPQNVSMTFVLKQEGDKLTGTQSGAAGEPKVTGTVKGNKVEFSVEGKNRSGEPYKNSYAGTL